MAGKRKRRTRPAAKRAARTPAEAPYTAAEITKLEAALRLANARFAGMVGISADAIITIDESQRIVLWNRGAEEIFGYVADEIVGQPLTLLLPDAARGLHTEHVKYFAGTDVLARHMGARRPIEGRRRNGEIFPAEASISQMRIGDHRFFTAVLRDVTENRRLLIAAEAARTIAEAAERRSAFLAEASALMDRSLDYATTLGTLARLIVPHLADCAIIDVAGADGRVERLGAAHADAAAAGLMERLRQFPKDPGLPFLTRHTLATGESQRASLLTEGQLEDLTQGREHREIVRELAPASWLVVPLLWRERVVGAMALIRCGAPQPYTDAELALARELAQRAAQAVENARLYGAAQAALSARDDMLAVVSHDLRSPLAAIQMCTGTLLERPSTDRAAATEILTTIVQSVEWMNRIIQDLLDIASIEGGRLAIYPQRTSAVEIVALARPSLDALTQAHDFVVTLAPVLPPLRADAERIAQVLANLVNNAAKYTRAGGAISLTIDADAAGVRFTVRDAGSGIPAEHVPHVFERFWHERRDSGLSGTGLGLAIAKGIVEAHGGEIGVESEIERGSTFWFRLPADRLAERG